MNSQKFSAFKNLFKFISKPKATNPNAPKTVTIEQQDIDWEAIPSH
jgi:hypothetical protein